MIARGDIEPPFYTADLVVDDVELWTPVLDVQFASGIIQLTHYNTLVRTFDDETANHIEYRLGSIVKGLRMAEEMMDLMLDYDYSYRWDKRVDENTINWLVALESSNLDDEIDELEGESDE